MDWLSQRNFDMDIGAQLPHAALRVYVMGERGARRDPATPEDNRAMAALAGDAVRRARWASRPRAPSTIAPLPAISRRP